MMRSFNRLSGIRPVFQRSHTPPPCPPIPWSKVLLHQRRRVRRTLKLNPDTYHAYLDRHCRVNSAGPPSAELPKLHNVTN
ncbi:hypothetical protein BDV98DRAFT_248774 [Pterulicium gracile]|uniref:Uncharacterized protein n=1 Tax=Pterulicium gracile TaxID=1884261 RepID=A0A5C3Q8R7_9AGAR|nr:hypothetical protein BDV98DRAFT_248774 [Pterula gracilis]